MYFRGIPKAFDADSMRGLTFRVSIKVRHNWLIRYFIDHKYVKTSFPSDGEQIFIVKVVRFV